MVPGCSVVFLVGKQFAGMGILAALVVVVEVCGECVSGVEVMLCSVMMVMIGGRE